MMVLTVRDRCKPYVAWAVSRWWEKYSGISQRPAHLSCRILLPAAATLSPQLGKVSAGHPGGVRDEGMKDGVLVGKQRVERPLAASESFPGNSEVALSPPLPPITQHTKPVDTKFYSRVRRPDSRLPRSRVGKFRPSCTAVFSSSQPVSPEAKCLRAAVATGRRPSWYLVTLAHQSVSLCWKWLLNTFIKKYLECLAVRGAESWYYWTVSSDPLRHGKPEREAGAGREEARSGCGWRRE
ncbi:hypothetical protein E2C01_038094 [Portunus trituberculatus]|uniref:Uncharacterized protein n=1 Tax=Portunus trituberculatus TaxID=210409 RepID=A0A5B7FBA7_PORTR|nr:hypothetical protein [Portunus trituberculatus]